MNKTIFLFTTIFIFSIQTFSATISGKVSSTEKQAVTQAKVSLPVLSLTTFTDTEGNFSFTNIPKGNYLISVSLFGYQNQSKEISVAENDVALEIILEASNFLLPDVTISAEPQPSDILESALPVSVLEGNELNRHRGQSVMQSLEHLPGVSVFSGGPLAMKPVIRGLTAQRVVVVENGTRIEGQTWDEPQSSEINSMDVERIEIVRGPSSVIYGSDALGGVVNVISGDIFQEENKTLAGNFSLNAFRNNTGVAGSLNLFGQIGRAHV